MSIRRRSSAKVSPADTPNEAESSSGNNSATRIPRRSNTQRSNTQRSDKIARATPNVSRPVALQAPRPVVDLSLEQLLEIKPPCVRNSVPLEGDKATAQRVEEAKEALGKLECEIVTALFPPSGMPESPEDIAARLGMTIKEVRDVADNALRGLRGTKSSRPRLSSVWN